MTTYEPKLLQSRRLIKSSPVDPMELEAWTLAATIAWIKVRHLPEAVRSERVRDAYHYEYWGFPVDEHEHLPNVEGRLLMDEAIKGNVQIYSPDGGIDVSQFGPNSEVVPTGPELELCIFPKFRGTRDCPADGRAITGVWCFRTRVQQLWPAGDQADPPAQCSGGKQVENSRYPELILGGLYEKHDAPLRLEIIRMVEEGRAVTVESAARELAFADRIAGRGSPENRATRLAKQVLRNYPGLSTRKNSEQART